MKKVEEGASRYRQVIPIRGLRESPIAFGNVGRDGSSGSHYLSADDVSSAISWKAGNNGSNVCRQLLRSLPEN